MKSADIWDKNSLQWNRIGPPLRPSGQDIDLMQRSVAERCAAAGWAAPRALLLGVTPEIATMRWPHGTCLLAIDRHLPMIENVWPGRELAGAMAVCAEWTLMPMRDQSCDVVVGDGCFMMLPYPDGYGALMREIRRVLRGNGLLAMRVFIKPEMAESVAAVFEELNGGRIGNFHAFKWRMNMALQNDLAAGVRLGDIWDVWNAAFPEPGALAQKLGWSIETIRTIETYRGSDTRYTYPRLSELRHALSHCFSEAACIHPDYELGERCPTLLFKPR